MLEMRDALSRPDFDEVTVEALLTSLSTSDWLKRALRTALNRDVVDAANDAEILARVLSARAEQALASSAALRGGYAGRHF